MCACVRACMFTLVNMTNTCGVRVYVCVCICIRACTVYAYIFNEFSVRVYMYASIYACVAHACTNNCVWSARVHILVWTHACTFLLRLVFMCACVYEWFVCRRCNCVSKAIRRGGVETRKIVQRYESATRMNRKSHVTRSLML